MQPMSRHHSVKGHPLRNQQQKQRPRTSQRQGRTWKNSRANPTSSTDAKTEALAKNIQPKKKKKKQRGVFRTTTKFAGDLVGNTAKSARALFIEAPREIVKGNFAKAGEKVENSVGRLLDDSAGKIIKGAENAMGTKIQFVEPVEVTIYEKKFGGPKKPRRPTPSYSSTSAPTSYPSLPSTSLQSSESMTRSQLTPCKHPSYQEGLVNTFQQNIEGYILDISRVSVRGRSKETADLIKVFKLTKKTVTILGKSDIDDQIFSGCCTALRMLIPLKARLALDLTYDVLKHTDNYIRSRPRNQERLEKEFHTALNRFEKDYKHSLRIQASLPLRKFWDTFLAKRPKTPQFNTVPGRPLVEIEQAFKSSAKKGIKACRTGLKRTLTAQQRRLLIEAINSEELHQSADRTIIKRIVKDRHLQNQLSKKTRRWLYSK